jgi:hypothetical protein
MDETSQHDGVPVAPIDRKEEKMTTNSFSIAPLPQSMNEYVLAPQAVAGDQATALDRSRASLARQIAIKRGLLASKRPMKQREARILYLRSQIEADVYRVSSAELAARLLENWTHFLDEP